VLDVAPAPGRPGEAHALIDLGTGRFHQIRAMLAALGAPLVGDALYGGAPGPFYLEHAALFFTDFSTRRGSIAHLPGDPEREPLFPPLQARLDAIVSGG
ncbi:MAG: hypothetical protein ACREID_00525, partial [Planctomycetota bacterium]